MQDSPQDKSPSQAEAARRHVEWLVERNRRDTGIDYAGVEPRPIRSVGIVGAGMMGTAIAATCVKADLPVVIADADERALRAAPGRIAQELAQQTESSDTQCAERVGRLVEPTADAARLARCDLVLESVVETVPGKQEVYARLAPHLAEATILASNTSTIPIGRLAAGLPDPGRFCGIHFFHPVRHRSLVEIVRGPKTGDATIAAAVGHAKRIQKMPIVVEDGPAFLVNRLLLPYLIEAMDLLLDGASIDQIERAATEFGMAIGPLRILDEIGIDTVVNAGRVLWQAFPERIVASPLLITMYKKGRLGRKSGAGFFSYASETAWDGPSRPDPSVEQLIAQWARPPQPLTAETITHRLILPMVLEATRLLEEGKVRHPGDIDLAVLFGLGFPASRGGLLYWADSVGADRILDMLRPLEALGPRLQPTRLLQETGRDGSRFYETSSSGS
jgi:3-hydroxyacyl-CoA dehydrogenase/enoyl-CoA hydratase/3-hydroxybutyryl-CoA epimerase/3-hydroxyacyl-CoA dehydrogenase/enoyl-CoA hydratase/3-hydroxybutyryl-CoA epimerase/enoyl-CoA isomerase